MKLLGWLRYNFFNGFQKNVGIYSSLLRYCKIEASFIYLKPNFS